MPCYPLTLYFDGDCPICRFEVAQLRARDRARQLRFIDIAAPSFVAEPDDPRREEMLARIHARRADGRWLHGMAVFRAAYRAVGLGWIVAPSGWPLLAPLADRLYALFARHRRRLAARSGDLFDGLALMRQRRQARESCAGRCEAQSR